MKPFFSYGPCIILLTETQTELVASCVVASHRARDIADSDIEVEGVTECFENK